MNHSRFTSACGLRSFLPPQRPHTLNFRTAATREQVPAGRFTNIDIYALASGADSALADSSLRMARVYASVNQEMPRAYWDYDSVNISWGVLENYEVVRKIGVSGQEHA